MTQNVSVQNSIIHIVKSTTDTPRVHQEEKLFLKWQSINKILYRTWANKPQVYTPMWVNQPRHPSAGELDNLCYIQTVERYLALKINALPRHKKTWRILQCLSLSKRSQSEKAPFCVILTIRNSGKGNAMETGKRPVVFRGLRWGEMSGWSTEDLEGGENTLHALMTGACR